IRLVTTAPGMRVRRSPAVRPKNSTPIPIMKAPSPTPRKSAAITGIGFSSAAAIGAVAGAAIWVADVSTGAGLIGAGVTTGVVLAAAAPVVTVKEKLPPTGCPSAERTRHTILLGPPGHAAPAGPVPVKV